MLAICGPGWKSVPGTCKTRSLGLRPERIDTAAKSVRPNRCQVEIGARWKSVPGTCQGRQAPVPGRGGMLAICGRTGNRCQAPAQDAPGC